LDLDANSEFIDEEDDDEEDGDDDYEDVDDTEVIRSKKPVAKAIK
jgi:hypothetical protein